MATFSNEQFQMLLEAIKPQTTNNNPAALGPMKPCILGPNKMTSLKHFEEWLEEAENRMTYIGTQHDPAKVILLKSWGAGNL